MLGWPCSSVACSSRVRQQNEQKRAGIRIFGCALPPQPSPTCPFSQISVSSLSPRLCSPCGSCHFLTTHASLHLGSRSGASSSMAPPETISLFQTPMRPVRATWVTIIVQLLVLLNYLFSSGHTCWCRICKHEWTDERNLLTSALQLRPQDPCKSRVHVQHGTSEPR